MKPNVCVVVIGHVDHGKTTLVRTLTGIETDRLPEEKARGLSIAPGFAHLTTPAGTVDLVDAPGHEDFVHAMIAGAAGATAALVVISATEGIAPQTTEHLAIARLLGISRAVVAVTKADLLPKAEHAEHLKKIRQAAALKHFSDTEIVLCAAPTGEGIDDIKGALAKLLSAPPGHSNPPFAFLPIDRVFSLAGQGTIVTGTLQGQPLNVGDRVTLAPGNRSVTLRGLHSRDAPRENVQVGERMAANLRGVAVDDIARGDVLGAGSTLHDSLSLDVTLTQLPGTKIKHLQEVRVFFGTANRVAQLRLFRQAQNGGPCFAQLRFRKPLCGFEGQRGILRRLSPPATIGGFTILDTQATATRSNDAKRIALLSACDRSDAVQIASALAEIEGGVASMSDIARLSGVPLEEALRLIRADFTDIGNGHLAKTSTVETAQTQVLMALNDYHRTNPLHAMAPRRTAFPRRLASQLEKHIEATLLAAETIRQRATGLALATHDPLAQMTDTHRHRMREIEGMFRDAHLKPLSLPPSPDTKADADLIALLEDAGTLIRLQNIGLNQTLTFHTDALGIAAIALRDAFPAPQSFTTSAARSALNTTRKVIVPLLEHFDQSGITTRTGNTRQMRD